jgi:hypothetical protein
MRVTVRYPSGFSSRLPGFAVSRQMFSCALLFLCSLPGCAYCLRVFEYPETLVDGTVTDAAGTPLAESSFTLVLVRGSGYQTARQDAAENRIAGDSPAYMTAEVRSDVDGRFHHAFPPHKYKTCDRAVLIPGHSFVYKHGGKDEILLLYSARDPQTEWYAVQVDKAKARAYLLRGSKGNLARLSKSVEVADIKATAICGKERNRINLNIVNR